MAGHELHYQDPSLRPFHVGYHKRRLEYLRKVLLGSESVPAFFPEVKLQWQRLLHLFAQPCQVILREPVLDGLKREACQT